MRSDFLFQKQLKFTQNLFVLLPHVFHLSQTRKTQKPKAARFAVFGGEIGFQISVAVGFCSGGIGERREN